MIVTRTHSNWNTETETQSDTKVLWVECTSDHRKLHGAFFTGQSEWMWKANRHVSCSLSSGTLRSGTAEPHLSDLELSSVRLAFLSLWFEMLFAEIGLDFCCLWDTFPAAGVESKVKQSRYEKPHSKAPISRDRPTGFSRAKPRVLPSFLIPWMCLANVGGLQLIKTLT